MEFKDQVVIVTGGSRGIGAAICRELAAGGARVVVNYNRSADAAVALAEAIGGLAVCADVSTTEGCEHLAQQAEAFESKIGKGLLCLVGIEASDEKKDIDYIAKKVMTLRLWPDGENRPWSLNVAQAQGSILCVSQFTLSGRTRKGTKPDFSRAMAPDRARSMYDEFVATLRRHADEQQVAVKDGVFAAMMDVSLTNDGPVTILLDSAND